MEQYSDKRYKDGLVAKIRVDGEWICSIEIVDDKFITSGTVGENEFDNLVEVLKYLCGFDISLDDFFWN